MLEVDVCVCKGKRKVLNSKWKASERKKEMTKKKPKKNKAWAMPPCYEAITPSPMQ
jgi:hypothetical protein